VDALRGCHRCSGGKQFRVLVEPGLEDPYSEKSFDQSLSLLVLMFIADVDKAISEMKRVTKPGGTVAACVWEKEGMKMGAIFWEVAIKVDPAAQGSAEKMAVLYNEGMLSDQ